MSTLKNQLFAYTQMREIQILRQGELQSALGITARQEMELLSRLARQKMIIRLKRGVYLIPQKIPPGEKWQPETLYLIYQYMRLYDANYYISGLYAFNYYGLSEQIPNQVTIYNDRLSLRKKLGVLNVILVKVDATRIGKIKKIQSKSGGEVSIATCGRTVLDAVMDWSRFGTLPMAFKWIDFFVKDKVFLKELVSATVKYGNVSAKRRIGAYLEEITKDKVLVKPILETLQETKNWLPLDPTAGTKGKTIKKWRIIYNVK